MWYLLFKNILFIYIACCLGPRSWTLVNNWWTLLIHLLLQLEVIRIPGGSTIMHAWDPHAQGCLSLDHYYSKVVVKWQFGTLTFNFLFFLFYFLFIFLTCGCLVIYLFIKTFELCETARQGHLLISICLKLEVAKFGLWSIWIT